MPEKLKRAWRKVVVWFSNTFDGTRGRIIGAAILILLIGGVTFLLRGEQDAKLITTNDPSQSLSDDIEDVFEPAEIDPTTGEAATSSKKGKPKVTVQKENISSTGKVLTTRKRTNVGVKPPPTSAGTIPPGIDFKNQIIKVAYYWKDDSRASAFLPPGTSGDTVDDYNAFEALVKFINDHGDGSASLMGTKIAMGNWIIEPFEITMNSADEINAGTTEIAQTIKPFAAISARGSLSVDACPVFAGAGIHNFATLSYLSNLLGATKGYCYPSALSWDQQVDATVNYMKWHKDQPLVSANRPRPDFLCASGCDRVYGFLHAEYTGLLDQVDKVVARLRSAGVDIAEVASVTGLTDTQGAIAAKNAFIDAGVNTVIMPDGGAPLAFTNHAGDYQPDYYVWPCSGQDATGYTVLLGKNQWDNATGLSCYSSTFDSALVPDTDDKQTEYYKAFLYGAPSGSEAPGSTHLVYASLQPIVVGVSGMEAKGLAFTVQNFRKRLAAFAPYRYNGISGKSTKAVDLKLLMGNSSDGSPWGDIGRVHWDIKDENPYTFLDNHRYTSSQSFP